MLFVLPGVHRALLWIPVALSPSGQFFSEKRVPLEEGSSCWSNLCTDGQTIRLVTLDSGYLCHRSTVSLCILIDCTWFYCELLDILWGLRKLVFLIEGLCKWWQLSDRDGFVAFQVILVPWEASLEPRVPRCHTFLLQTEAQWDKWRVFHLFDPLGQHLRRFKFNTVSFLRSSRFSPQKTIRKPETTLLGHGDLFPDDGRIFQHFLFPNNQGQTPRGFDLYQGFIQPNNGWFIQLSELMTGHQCHVNVACLVAIWEPILLGCMTPEALVEISPVVLMKRSALNSLIGDIIYIYIYYNLLILST